MKRLSLVALLLCIFSVISCTTGLGELVDIEAPEITVEKMVCNYIDTEDGQEKTAEFTSFASTIYTKKKVSFSGSAYDNTGVKTVYAEINWINEENSGSDEDNKVNAVLNKDSWTIDLEFEKEGSCQIVITAEDKKGKENIGIKSSKTIYLFVDENAPVGSDWYIDRLVNGIRYNLQSKEKLLEIIANDQHLLDPQNKDVAQNGEFLICSSFNDAAGIFNKDETGNETSNPTTTISIFDINGIKIAGPLTAEPSSGNYSPKFRINDNVLNNFKNDEQTLLQVRYSSKDIVTVPAPNEVKDKEIEWGWFIWCPDSDSPRCSITGHDKDETVNVYVGDKLNITVFDDDGLAGEVEWYKENTLLGSKTVTNADREVNIIIDAPDVPESFKLKIVAHDLNEGEKQRSMTFEKNVNVIDQFQPTLIITSPENNQIPNVSGDNADITFSGVALDTTGCKYLEFVWVPDSVTTDSEEKRVLAKELLDSLNATDPDTAGQNLHDKYKPASGTAVKVTEFSDGKFKGIKLWSAALVAKPGTDEKFKQQKFSFEISLLNDFGSGENSETNKEKYFFARLLRDASSTPTDSEFKLAADNIVPEIIPVNPSGNMAIIDEESDFVIKFKAQKENGLLMNTSKYKIEYYPYNSDTVAVLEGRYDEDEGVYIGNTVSKEILKAYTNANKNPKVILYAEDVLGNKTNATYQAIISALPKLNTITSSAPAKCKAGDPILINASFSKAFTIPADKTADVKLKLRNIKNEKNGISENKTVYAKYKEGNGSTTLVFEYTVQPGDTSDGLQVYNEENTPIEGIATTLAHIETLTTENNLQNKRSANPIKIDGIVPKATGVTVTTDADRLKNVNGGITFLRAGKTITAKITTDKAVTVQGSPKLKLNNITLDWQSINTDGNEITFSKKITTEKEGALSYTADCIEEIDSIKDDFGNALVSSITAADANVEIDRTKPEKPSITVLNTNKGSEGKYNGSAYFTVTVGTDTNLAKTEYSTDGGRNWNDYSTTVNVTSTSSLVARSTDWAGNVSDYSDPKDVEINDTFPDFTVECTNSDGRYKLGETLEFKVYFANEVDIPADSAAYISLSAETGTITSNAKATITETSKGNNVTEATFEYTVQEGDDFTLKVAKDGVNLSGVKDKYGVAWNSTKKQLSADYSRADLHCDTVLPYVVSMTPQGTKSTQNGLNAYTNAKQIKITFNEPVSVVSGKIYLRQTSGWAIPPMFTAEEFSKVLAAVNGITVTESGKTLTGSQVLYMDGLEDAENLYGALVGPANDRYHGTAQYVGPYKKMTNGIDGSGNPDLSVKYVLDFGVDIWDKDNSTKKNFGKTFVPNYSKDGTTYTYMTYHKDNQKGWVNVITPETVITTDTIRTVLEKAHFHERYMNVNSTYVEVSEDRKTYTLNFPEGVLGESNLPLGREWELVIDKGAFMDETGNYFGAESDGTINKETTTHVLVKEGNSTDGYNNSFMSAGVEQPVIRVNRYSYGLGIKQPKLVNGNIVEEQIEILETTGAKWKAGEGLTTPSAYVQVKIDCESRAATVRYAMNSSTSNNSSSLTNIAGFGGTKLSSHVSTTNTTIPTNATTGTSKGSAATKIVFLAGSGDYTKSCKAYITADATSTGATSSVLAKEGVFQTVVDFNDPQNSGTKKICDAGDGIQAVNIHGTTGNGGVPSIAPFPLRDQPVSSAYMRQTYQKGDQYYWVSYEVLTQSIFSMYAYGKCGAGSVYTNDTGRWYDWSPEYGTMRTGEFTRCDGMHSYTEDF